MNNNCGLFMINKALKHLVNATEDHLSSCGCKDESLAAMNNFSNEIMKSDIVTSGNKMMQNIESQLNKIQNRYNQLAKVIVEVINNNKSIYKLKNACLCGSLSLCQVHGRNSQTKL